MYGKIILSKSSCNRARGCSWIPWTNVTIKDKINQGSLYTFVLFRLNKSLEPLSHSHKNILIQALKFTVQVKAYENESIN